MNKAPDLHDDAVVAVGDDATSPVPGCSIHWLPLMIGSVSSMRLVANRRLGSLR